MSGALPKLIAVVGTNASGKSSLAISLARSLGGEVISADSRQVYRGLDLGSGKVTAQEMQGVPHHLLDVCDPGTFFTMADFQRLAYRAIDDVLARGRVPVLAGGTGLYVDAVCKGLDEIPTVSAEVQQQVRGRYAEEGLAWLQQEVQRRDPAYWEKVDRQNPQRLIHCLEVSMQTGKPYSALRKGVAKTRDFRIVKVVLTRPREELYERINKRVEQMMAAGMEEEARAVYAYRKCNSLQTVGYRELFAYMDGEYDRARAVELIQQNSRRYAKRQLTWFRRDAEMRWVDLSEEHMPMEKILKMLLINEQNVYETMDI